MRAKIAANSSQALRHRLDKGGRFLAPVMILQSENLFAYVAVDCLTAKILCCLNLQRGNLADILFAFSFPRIVCGLHAYPDAASSPNN